ncbi:DoxX family protein [Catelliglobosispora koreensis]|uniref:DoxX family protein n=1 Tax=Catelliglobosispora koreensis TaxID=129052 RepID=UPI0003A2C85A|nr:DoxX family protein [Catelliglobosispora koreensis]
MRTSRFTEVTTTLFRVVVGLLFTLHGASSLFGVFGGNRGSGQAVEFASWPGWWAAAIQFAGGLMVLAGLGTRVAALVCSGSMAYAYFVVHQPLSLLPLNNGGELAAMFCWSFLLVAAIGPGAWSLDALLSARKTNTAPIAEPVAS